jgi:hypothetical protein
MNPSNPCTGTPAAPARPFSLLRSRAGRGLGLVPFLAYAACAVPLTDSQAPDVGADGAGGPGDREVGAMGAAASKGREKIGFAPAQGSGTQLDYQGGDVMAAPKKVFYIWYGTWTPISSTVTILEDFAKNLGGSPYFNINTGYSDNGGGRVSNAVTFGGSVFVGAPFGNALTNSDIRNVVQLELDIGFLPVDPNAVYFVMTSSEVSESGSQSNFCSGGPKPFCAWHTAGTIDSSDIKYAFVGSPLRCPSTCGWGALGITGPNGNQEADGMVTAMVHELEESATDPDLDAWTDTDQTENGDLCNFFPGPTYAAGGGAANVHLGARDYLIQQNWVNTPFGGCDMRFMLTKPMSGMGRTTGDFNGDTGSDILWRNAATHEVSVWTMFGATPTAMASLGVVDPAWQIYGVADFNNDHKADILWFNRETNATSIWLMNGTTRSSILNPGGIPIPLLHDHAQIQAAVDLNADGRADILWRQPGNSQLIAQITVPGGAPTTALIGNVVPAAWQVVGTGDFDGDGHADILWQNNVTDDVSVWFLNGTTVTATPLTHPGTPGTPTTILGIADFNHDGRADILWTNAGSASINVWPSQLNRTIGAAYSIGTKPAGEWRVESASDFTGDANADVLWRNRRDGSVRLWTVNGAAHSEAVVSSGVSLPWEIIRN